MAPARGSLRCILGIVLAVLVCTNPCASAQSCQTSGDLDDPTRSAIVAAAQGYFNLAAKGDVATLRQNAIASLAADFSAVETAVKEHQQDLAGAQVAYQMPMPVANDKIDDRFVSLRGRNGHT